MENNIKKYLQERQNKLYKAIDYLDYLLNENVLITKKEIEHIEQQKHYLDIKLNYISDLINNDEDIHLSYAKLSEDYNI